jgi:nitrogen-specific signal transduction histidine kinase
VACRTRSVMLPRAQRCRPLYPCVAISHAAGEERGPIIHKAVDRARDAIKGGRIDVIARPAPQGGTASVHDRPLNTPSFLEICVCDFGLGIPGELLERIFEHFFRVDTRLTREVSGLGLGFGV